LNVTARGTLLGDLINARRRGKRDYSRAAEWTTTVLPVAPTNVCRRRLARWADVLWGRYGSHAVGWAGRSAGPSARPAAVSGQSPTCGRPRADTAVGPNLPLAIGPADVVVYECILTELAGWRRARRRRAAGASPIDRHSVTPSAATTCDQTPSERSIGRDGHRHHLTSASTSS
jgi:hypothetical protein